MTIIDKYFEDIESTQKAELERIRSIAKAMLPDAEEAISYGMPTIKLNGKSVIGFDAHKNHIGIYPFSGSVISKIAELKEYAHTEGAIREQLDNLLPESLVQKIIRERLKQIAKDSSK